MKEGARALATKRRVLRWYFQQLRLAWKLTILTVGVATAASVLLDVVMPLLVVQISEKHAQGAEFGEFKGPLIGLVLCLLGGCVLSPLRNLFRRLLHDKGDEGLKAKIQEAIAKDPSLKSKMDKFAIREFLDSWVQLTHVLVESIRFAVGVSGLIAAFVVFDTPLAVPVVILVLLGTVWVARKVGGTLTSTWKEYKDRDHEELTLISGQIASAEMGWLVRIMADLSRVAGTARKAAMRTYLRAMVCYQLAMTGLSEGFKVIAVAGGVVLGSVYGASVGVTTLLLVYGLVLGDRMNTVFGMNEMLSSSQVEAEALVRALESAKPLGPELRAAASVVKCRRAVVEYEKTNTSSAPATSGTEASGLVVVEIPDMEIRPGITLIMGPSGRGKTTLLRALNGRPYKGSITLGGVEIAGHDPRLRLVYGQQSLEPLEATTALDLFGGAVSEEVNRALWCAGYPEAPLDRKVDEYSGGQYKRLLLAAEFYATLQRDRGLAMLLALDEPTNHLDSGAVGRLLRGIRWIADNDPGLAIPIVTHDDRMKSIHDNIIDLGEV